MRAGRMGLMAAVAIWAMTMLGSSPVQAASSLDINVSPSIQALGPISIDWNTAGDKSWAPSFADFGAAAISSTNNHQVKNTSPNRPVKLTISVSAISGWTLDANAAANDVAKLTATPTAGTEGLLDNSPAVTVALEASLAKNTASKDFVLKLTPPTAGVAYSASITVTVTAAAP